MKNVLKVFTNRRIAVTLVLAFSSSLPLPLVWGTLDAWMASEKVDLRTIGLFSMVQLPYTFKVLWAPLLDRFSLPFLGRRTSWMVVFQVLLIFGIVAMGLCNPLVSPSTLAVAALITAFFSASQDIVIDGYRAELLVPVERGAGAAVTVLGGRIALLTAGAGALILSDLMPWRHVYFIMAGLMSVGLVTSFLAPAPAGVPAPPRTLGLAVVEPFKNFFSRPGAWTIVFIVIFYKLGDAFAGKMITPFLIQHGFTRTEIGTVNKGFGMISTITGALIGGGILARIGIRRSLVIFGILQALSNLVFVALAQSGQSYPLLFACIGVENLCGGMGTAAFVAFLMWACDKRYSGTQYALLTSIMTLGRTLVGPLTGYLAVRLGWAGYFAVAVLLAVPGLLLLFTPRARKLGLDAQSA